MGKDKNKDKEHHEGETAATSKTNSPWDGCRDSRRDLSQDRATKHDMHQGKFQSTLKQHLRRRLSL